MDGLGKGGTGVRGGLDGREESSGRKHRNTHVRNWEDCDCEMPSSTFRLSSHTSIAAERKTLPTPSGTPYTHHPFFHRRLSLTTQNLLLSILDVLMIAILAAHIATYFISLPTAIKLCYLPEVLSHPNLRFGETKRMLSMRDRCIGLNMDIHIAGGFAVFMAIVLGVLHLAALVVRVWECVRIDREEWAGPSASMGQDVGMGASLKSSAVCTSARGSSTIPSTQSPISTARNSPATSTGRSRNTTSISVEELGTGIRFVDRGAGGTERTTRRRTDRSGESETLKGLTRWSEVLLECLIDA